MNETVLMVMVAFVEAFLHYFPWRLILKRELPRLAAYVLGVLGLMVPFTAWLVEQKQNHIAIVLWSVIATGGLSIVVLHALDDWINQRLGKHDAEERERNALLIVKELTSGTGE